MGKFVALAVSGLALFVGCSGGLGTTGLSDGGEGAEVDAGDPQGSAIAAATDPALKDAASPEGDGAVEDVPDAGAVDAAGDAGDASLVVDAGQPPTTFTLPARLVIEPDGSMCWSEGAEIGTVCNLVPLTDPPLIRTDDQCGTPTAWPIVHARVAPGTCAKITGQWANACIANPSEPTTRCAKVTNTLDHDLESGRLYKRIVIEWRSGASCSCPP